MASRKLSLDKYTDNILTQFFRHLLFYLKADKISIIISGFTVLPLYNPIHFKAIKLRKLHEAKALLFKHPTCGNVVASMIKFYTDLLSNNQETMIFVIHVLFIKQKRKFSSHIFASSTMCIKSTEILYFGRNGKLPDDFL